MSLLQRCIGSEERIERMWWLSESLCGVNAGFLVDVRVYMQDVCGVHAGAFFFFCSAVGPVLRGGEFAKLLVAGRKIRGDMRYEVGRRTGNFGDIKKQVEKSVGFFFSFEGEGKFLEYRAPHNFPCQSTQNKIIIL